MRVPHRLLAKIAMYLLATCAPELRAAEPTDIDAVNVVIVDGQTVEGRAVGLQNNQIEIANNTKLPLEDIVRVDFRERPSQRPSGTPVIYFANGDRIVAKPTAIDEESIKGEWVRLSALPDLTIPLETVRACLLTPPQIASSQHALEAQLAGLRPTTDVIMLSNGDNVTGELTGMNGDALMLKSAVGETRIERGGVEAVAFNAELISFPASEELQLIVQLRDGSRVSVRNAEWNTDRTLRCETLYGLPLELPLTEISSLQVRGGRAVYLSDLKPVTFEHTPYVSGAWPFIRDRAVDGGPLLLRGREYAKGIGVHSRCKAVYDLAGQYEKFLATIGVDDSAGGKGSAAVTIEVDSKQIFQAEKITGVDPPLHTGPLDVRGGKQLTLTVEFGPQADILDRIDWCDAVLIKKRANGE